MCIAYTTFSYGSALPHISLLPSTTLRQPCPKNKCNFQCSWLPSGFVIWCVPRGDRCVSKYSIAVDICPTMRPTMGNPTETTFVVDLMYLVPLCNEWYSTAYKDFLDWVKKMPLTQAMWKNQVHITLHGNSLHMPTILLLS